MREIHKVLGNMVREHREKKKMTQLELAEVLGYHTSQFISLIERGVAKIPIEIIGKMVIILELPEKKIIKYIQDTYMNGIIAQLEKGKADFTKK